MIPAPDGCFDAVVVGEGGRLQAVALESGEAVTREGLFLRPPQVLRSELPQRLGCPIASEGRVEADTFGWTGVPGVYVAGDTGPGVQQVIAAAASGATAAMALNRNLLGEEFEG